MHRFVVEGLGEKEYSYLMEGQPPITYFAPAGRLDPESIQAVHDVLCGHFIAETMDAMPLVVLLLNEQRQIVLANAQALHALGAPVGSVLGKRPGEALRCIHAPEGPEGCGTSLFCSRCGAVRAVLGALEGHYTTMECSLLRGSEHGVEAMDLDVSSTPITVDGRKLVIFTIQDVSDQKRRRFLEIIFFHDLLNTAGGLKGLTGLLSQEVPEHLREDAALIHASLSQLVDELLSQKDLLAAENHELRPIYEPLEASEMLEAVSAVAASLDQAKGKTVLVEAALGRVAFVSDRTLVRRVLGNMAKNAVEATQAGGSVALSCAPDGDRVVFAVRNPGVMSQDACLNMFKRNFSTKGPGRGIGAYGMKLLAERYLNGQVWFTSDAASGTCFFLSLPADPRPALPPSP